MVRRVVRREELAPILVPDGVIAPPGAGAYRQELAEFWDARENLKIIRDWAQSQIVSPLAVLGYCMARALADLPPQITVPPVGDSNHQAMRGSVNMFAAMAGPSGEGKGEARKAATVLVPMETPVYGAGSGQGIGHMFKELVTVGESKGSWQWKSRSAFVDVSEVDKLAGLVAQKGSILLPVLRSAWCGELLGEHNAEKGRRLKIEEQQYRLCMVAGIQPDRAGVLLDDTDGGTPQRWIWLPTYDLDPPDTEPVIAPGPLQCWSQEGWLKNENELTPDDDYAIYRNQVIDVWDGAREEMKAARRARTYREETNPRTSHALFCQLKNAVAIGDISSPGTPLQVTQLDWQLAGVLSRVSDQVQEEIAGVRSAARRQDDENRGRSQGRQQLAANETIAWAEQKNVERVAENLHRYLKETGDLTGPELRRKVAYRDREPYYEPALKLALERGELILEKEKYAAG